MNAGTRSCSRPENNWCWLRAAQALQAAAEQSRHRQEELLRAVAQALNNPFAPVRVAAAMMARPGANRDVLSRAQTMLERQVDQMSRRVGRLLAPERTDDVNVTAIHRRFDLCAAAADVARACQPALDAGPPDAGTSDPCDTSRSAWRPASERGQRSWTGDRAHRCSRSH